MGCYIMSGYTTRSRSCPWCNVHTANILSRRYSGNIHEADIIPPRNAELWAYREKCLSVVGEKNPGADEQTGQPPVPLAQPERSGLWAHTPAIGEASEIRTRRNFLQLVV